MPERVSEFTVDRETWGTSTLLGDDGRMCCMGFLAIACGYTAGAIRGKSYPSSLPGFSALMPELRKDDELMIARVNDSVQLTRPAKESKLKDLFSRIGIALKFKGGSDATNLP